MQNFDLGRTVVLDHQRGLVHSWGIGKLQDKDCIPELGHECSAVVVAAASSGSGANTGTGPPDPPGVGSCPLGRAGTSEAERRSALCGSPDTVPGGSPAGPPQGSSS